MANNPSDAARGPARPSAVGSVLRGWRIVSAATALGLATAGVLTLASPPRYQATVEVVVRPTDITRDVTASYQSNLLAAALVKSYAHLMTGTVVVQGVVHTLKLPASVKSVQSRVQATPITDTNLISVSASDRHATTAARIADAVVSQLNAYLVKLASPTAPGPAADVIVVEPATVPTTLVSPQPVRNLGLGAVLGFLIGAALATWWDRRPRAAPVVSSETLEDPGDRHHPGHVPPAADGSRTTGRHLSKRPLQ
jgi:capsular polysaccharide biosynthesis protein